MSPTGRAYVTAFLARCAAFGQPLVDEPGFHGALASAGRPGVRLLVTEDCAHDRLAALLPAIEDGTVTVFDEARRCTELLARKVAWRSETATAMVHRDLGSVPTPGLPGELTGRPVRRVPTDPPDGVPLADAVALAILADETMDESAAAAYLRSMPAAFRLYAAVDAAGAVRATAGCGVFGPDASVIFVNTHPSWQRRGIGAAMTAAALRAARDAGARRACLDASPAGAGVYGRLGFERVSGTSRFTRPA